MNHTIELINKNGRLAISGADVDWAYKIDMLDIDADLTLAELDEDRVLIHRDIDGEIVTFAAAFDKKEPLNLCYLHSVLFDLRESGVINRNIKYARFPDGHVHHPIAF